MTVGSSSDQVINSYLYNANKVTLIDINPFIKYYYYLKKTGILTFKYKDFLNLFDYTNFFYNKGLREKILKELKNIDNDSYIFWNSLYSTYDSDTILSNLFQVSGSTEDIIKFINPYLSNKDNYKRARKALKYNDPTFINANIYNYNIKENYDILYLSNIPDYNDICDTDITINRALRKVKNVVIYSYDYSNIPDLVLKPTSMYSFKAAYYDKDSILIYKRR